MEEPIVVHTIYQNEDKTSREVYTILDNGSVKVKYQFDDGKRWSDDPEMGATIPAEVLDELLRHLHTHRGVPLTSSFTKEN